MTKILLPLLVLAGLGLGLALLVRRRRVTVPREGSWVKIAVLTAAALVVGTSGLADGKGKHKKTCYKPAKDPDFLAELDVDPMDEIQKRITLLEKLHEQGKLTDTAYSDTLAGIEADIAEAELEKWNKKALTKAEKKLVDMRRALDGKLLKKLNKQPAWKVLNKQVRQLLKLLDGKKNTYDVEAVDEAVDDLQQEGLIDPLTGSALLTVLHEVQYDIERSSAGQTCYKMSHTAWLRQGARGKLATLLTSIPGKKMTGKKFTKSLGTLASGVTCLQTTSEQVCDAGAGTYDRVSMVTTLDLLVSLAK
jgi:hypothetical protein